MQTVEEQLGKEALNEWYEHPVTAWFAKTIKGRADYATLTKAQVLIPGEPQRTQEIRSRADGALDELNALHGALSECWDESGECSLNFLVAEEPDEE